MTRKISFPIPGFGILIMAALMLLFAAPSTASAQSCEDPVSPLDCCDCGGNEAACIKDLCDSRCKAYEHNAPKPSTPSEHIGCTVNCEIAVERACNPGSSGGPES